MSDEKVLHEFEALGFRLRLRGSAGGPSVDYYDHVTGKGWFQHARNCEQYLITEILRLAADQEELQEQVGKLRIALDGHEEEVAAVTADRDRLVGKNTELREDNATYRRLSREKTEEAIQLRGLLEEVLTYEDCKVADVWAREEVASWIEREFGGKEGGDA